MTWKVLACIRASWLSWTLKLLAGCASLCVRVKAFVWHWHGFGKCLSLYGCNLTEGFFLLIIHFIPEFSLNVWVFSRSDKCSVLSAVGWSVRFMLHDRRFSRIVMIVIVNVDRNTAKDSWPIISSWFWQCANVLLLLFGYCNVLTNNDGHRPFHVC